MPSNNKTTFAFLTIGCRANQFQTEIIKSQLLTEQAITVKFHQVADVYVINTCAVTFDAERTSQRAIRRALRQNPSAQIIIAGCLANLNAKKLLQAFPNVKILCLNENDIFPALKSIRIAKVRENLMIQDGCECFCSYCIVPFARGKVKSKPLGQILKEANLLCKAGAKEIVLTGINLGTYGNDTKKDTLIQVIEQLSKIDNILRLRLSSIEPQFISEDLIRLMADNPKLCHSLHIPLQSGDDIILKAMRRPYKTDYYQDVIEKIRQLIPDCGIGSDIIVGFPGEDDKSFNKTVKFIKTLKFSYLHIFPYSKRPGTAAANFTNQVNPKIIKERAKCLRTATKKLMVDFANKYINKPVEVLVESKGVGLTSNFIRCQLNGKIGETKLICAKFVNNSGELIE